MYVPPPTLATFIIDTGADSTMVDDQIMRGLGLLPTGQTEIYTSTTNGIAEICDVYDIELQVLSPGSAPWVIGPVEALGRHLPNHSLQGMIGRDVLNRAILRVDGPGQTFQLDY
jgi:predicted aspartyl protease